MGVAETRSKPRCCKEDTLPGTVNLYARQADSLVAQTVKCLSRNAEDPSLSQEDPWRRKWQPTPVLLPGKSMGGGAWWAVAHGVAKSQTRLSDLISLSFRLRTNFYSPPLFSFPELLRLRHYFASEVLSSSRETDFL